MATEMSNYIFDSLAKLKERLGIKPVNTGQRR